MARIGVVVGAIVLLANGVLGSVLAGLANNGISCCCCLLSSPLCALSSRWAAHAPYRCVREDPVFKCAPLWAGGGGMRMIEKKKIQNCTQTHINTAVAVNRKGGKRLKDLHDGNSDEPAMGEYYLTVFVVAHKMWY